LIFCRVWAKFAAGLEFFAGFDRLLKLKRAGDCIECPKKLQHAADEKNSFDPHVIRIFCLNRVAFFAASSI
jgi:hypothetical protein